MSAQTKVSGYTETETLINYLKWLNGWSMSMLRAMRMMYNAIEDVRRLHHYNCDTSTLDMSFLLTKLDEMAVLLDGPATEMRNHFHLHHVGTSDGDLPIHISLEKAMQEIAKVCSGLTPVPVDSPIVQTLKDDCTINAATKKQFVDVVRKMCNMAETIQGFLTPLKFQYESTKAHFVLNMTVVDDNGRPIKIPDMDLDEEVRKFNEEKLAAALKAKEEAMNAQKPNDGGGGDHAIQTAIAENGQ